MEQNDIFNNTKQMILSRQTFKCANSPKMQIPGLNHYHCILWRHRDGLFDESGGQYDYFQSPQNQAHIMDMNNIIALCPSCFFTRNRNNQYNGQINFPLNIQHNVNQNNSPFNRTGKQKNFNGFDRMDCSG